MLKIIGKLTSSLVKSVTFQKGVNCGILSANSFSTWNSVFSSTAAKPLSTMFPTNLSRTCYEKPLLASSNLNVDQTRNVTKFSLKTGKKKSVNAVLKRFYRLDTGLWIRRRAGCHSGLHKKTQKVKWDLEQHVFCNQRQCLILDKMTTAYVKKRRYFIDDPFEPYQSRNNFEQVRPRRHHGEKY